MSDVVVIGGGVMGMLTSRELAKSGLKVKLIEKGELGGESSWAGGGILSPLYPWRYPDAVNKMACWSRDHYQTLAQQLKQESGIDPEWQQSGLLMLDADQIESAAHWAEDYKQPTELLDSGEISETEPSLGAVSERALLLPDIAHIRNPRLLKSLRISLEKLGVEIVEHTEVTNLVAQSGRITALELGSETLPASQIVVTCGAWSARLLASVGVQVDVQPVRGQMLLFKAVPGLVKHIIHEQGRYVIPRLDGHILVGSTLEHVDFDKGTTSEALVSLLETAYHLVPSLHEYQVVKHWAGLRPGTKDGIPYVGAHPDLAGVFVNTGHFRNGLVLAPSSARLLVEIMLEKQAHIDASMYSLVR